MTRKIEAISGNQLNSPDNLVILSIQRAYIARSQSIYEGKRRSNFVPNVDSLRGYISLNQLKRIFFCALQSIRLNSKGSGGLVFRVKVSLLRGFPIFLIIFFAGPFIF